MLTHARSAVCSSSLAPSRGRWLFVVFLCTSLIKSSAKMLSSTLHVACSFIRVHSNLLPRSWQALFKLSLRAENNTNLNFLYVLALAR